MPVFDVAKLLADHFQGDTGGAAILRAAGLLGDPQTGGTPVPAVPATPSQAADKGQESPAQRFLANLGRYTDRHGDPSRGRNTYGRPLLEAAAAKGLTRRTTMGGAPVGDPVKALMGGSDLGGAIHTKGEDAFQAFDLGDGRVAHVRFDDRGKRSVKVFRR